MPGVLPLDWEGLCFSCQGFGPQSSKSLDGVINTSHSSRFLVGSQAQLLLKAKSGGDDEVAELGRGREQLKQSCYSKLN